MMAHNDVQYYQIHTAPNPLHLGPFPTIKSDLRPTHYSTMPTLLLLSLCHTHCHTHRSVRPSTQEATTGTPLSAIELGVMKPGLNGASHSRRGYMGAAPAVGRKPPVDGCSVALRVFILAATLLAAVLMGVDRQTSTVQVTIADAPPLQVPVTAKWSYSSAFVYFVVANAMACAFSALSLVACRSRSAVVPLMIGDLVMLALLFSAVGAAAEFGILGERGNSHVQWGKVCHVYNKFCERAMAAVIVSLIAAFTNLVHLMLSILDIHKNSSYY